MSSGVYSQLTGYHNRRSIRLRGYDYSRPGYYFITICIHDHTQRLLGDISGGKMIPNTMGAIVDFTWHDLLHHVAGIALDEFVVMPNHVHGIIRIVGADFVGEGSEPSPTYPNTAPAPTGITRKRYALPETIRQFKTFSARRINEKRKTPGVPVWQRSYYDHIIRDEKALFLIRKYICENPTNWTGDSENHITREINEWII